MTFFGRSPNSCETAGGAQQLGAEIFARPNLPLLFCQPLMLITNTLA